MHICSSGIAYQFLGLSVCREKLRHRLSEDELRGTLGFEFPLNIKSLYWYSSTETSRQLKAAAGSMRFALLCGVEHV